MAASFARDRRISQQLAVEPVDTFAPNGSYETLVLSDIHLSDAHPVDKRGPLWMAYKRSEFFVDEDFRRLLDHFDDESDGPCEVVLNGDIFDFDNITRLPDGPPGPIDWLARLRGLASEEWMSLFKIDCIIDDHPIFFEALSRFVQRGNRAVFVIGNHDLELHWPRVQDRIFRALALPPVAWSRLLFCNWFFTSGDDTYISHGNQYDPYCVARDPIDPLVLMFGRPRVRIPFGDLAERYMLNGMGYFNPHATSNYIMSAGKYVRFFLKYMLRTQPLLVWTWFWSALVTLGMTLWEHWRPPMRDPLLVDEKVQAIADRSHATPSIVRKLNALNVPSASANPFKLMRELWLDRGLFFLGVVYGAFQLVLTVNFVLPISAWWVLVPLGLLFPVFLHYSFRVVPGVFAEPLLDEARADLIARITGARYVIFGHTHIPEMRQIGPVMYANCGFWSPAFAEPECQQRIGTQTYARLRPTEDGARRLELWEWPPGGTEPVPFMPETPAVI